MSAVRKSENPAATGFNANQNNLRADSNSFRQHEATTIVLLAQKGHTVTRGTNNDFFVGRWGLTRHCPDFTALENFARQLGVKQ